MKKLTSYQKYVALRDKKGLTDYAIAKATNLNRAMFSNWKNGRYIPKIDKLQKLADFFGISITELLGD